jgi:hypothetical protein
VSFLVGTGLDGQGNFPQNLGELRERRAALGIHRGETPTLLLHLPNVARIDRDGHPTGHEEVASVAILDVHDLASLAETANVLCEQNLHRTVSTKES